MTVTADCVVCDDDDGAAGICCVDEDDNDDDDEDSAVENLILTSGSFFRGESMILGSIGDVKTSFFGIEF